VSDVTGSDTLLTGATGFVGRTLARALAPTMGNRLRLFIRESSRLPPGLTPPLTAVIGDLLDPSALADATLSVGTVIHLAALTGKASRGSMLETNTEGTRSLLKVAKRAGVTRFLFVSSIAASFQDRRWYHYAESKRQAEQAVRESGLDWVIVRPTMVLGPGSPVQASLTRLASAPIGIMFGRGDVRVQPIHVGDLVAMLLALLDKSSFGGQIIEAGGPEVTSLSEMLGRIRVRTRGQPNPFLHLPLEPARRLLGMLDRPLWRLLPFTAGQLASFANEGVAARLPDTLPSPRHRIDDMLAGVGA